MQPLITRNDIARYRQIAKTANNDKLNELILDAQMLDLAPLLGESLYNSLLQAPAAHEELIDGGIYEADGISYTNYGLKMVLAYFAYARYVMFSSVIDTPFSLVEKLNSDSRAVEAPAKKTIYALNRDNAFLIWSNVKNYLERTKYTGFKNCLATSPAKGLRFTKIK